MTGKEKLVLTALLPVIATYFVYDWTTKTLKDISSHLPSPHLPILRPKLHEFKYKAKFSLR